MQRKEYVDIGANLCDSDYSRYKDLIPVLYRCNEKGVTKLVLTNSNIKDYFYTKAIYKIPEKDRSNVQLYTTLGFHPTRSNELTKENREKLKSMFIDPKNPEYDFVWSHVKAYGEFGLDYDRLHFATKEVQVEAFKWQLDLLKDIHEHQKKCYITEHKINEDKINEEEINAQINYLPMFLHCRNASEDFYPMLEEYLKKVKTFRGVVHSFTGTLEELNTILKYDRLCVSLNGVGFREECNIAVAKKIPLNKLQLETDCPYCEFKKTHASWPYIRKEALDSMYKHVINKKYSFDPEDKSTWNVMIKGRNEPCTISLVAEVYAAIAEDPEVKKIVNIDERVAYICRVVKQNSDLMFHI